MERISEIFICVGSILEMNIALNDIFKIVSFISAITLISKAFRTYQASSVIKDMGITKSQIKSILKVIKGTKNNNRKKFNTIKTVNGIIAAIGR